MAQDADEMHETVAKINQQVIGLERGHDALRQEVHAIDQKMANGFIAVDQKMANGFAIVDQKITSSFNAIANKLDQKTTPQWQAYGVLASVLVAIGGALFYPIREASNKHDAMIEAVRSQVVTRAEQERIWNAQTEKERTAEEHLRLVWDHINKTENELSYLKGQRIQSTR